MFKIFNRVIKLEQEIDYLNRDLATTAKGLATAVKALEDYLDVDFFHGDKSKPHYRKKRVIIKKLGRPRKIK